MEHRLNLNISDFCDDGKYARSHWVWSFYECKFNQRFFSRFSHEHNPLWIPLVMSSWHFPIRLCHCHTYWWFGLFEWLTICLIFADRLDKKDEFSPLLASGFPESMCTRRSFHHVQCIKHRLNLNYVLPIGEREKCVCHNNRKYAHRKNIV